MKKSFTSFMFLTLISIVSVSCSHQSSQHGEYQQYHRDVASSDCSHVRNAEYHSYFDNVEKCIEKQQD